MTSIHETAYPRLRSDWTEKLLIELFTPSPQEIAFARSCTRQPIALVSVLVQLKVFQYLGRFISFDQTPKSLIHYVASYLNIDRKVVSDIAHQPKQLKSRYVKLIRDYMKIAPFDLTAKETLQKIALKTAETKQHLPDIINILLEELVRLKIELPAFSFLRRLAQNARQQINKNCYQVVYPRLNQKTKNKLETLLHKMGNSTSEWDNLKQDVKKPTPQNIKEFVNYLCELQVWYHSLPTIDTIPPIKLHHFFLEAQSMDSAMLKITQAEKRYTLMVIYIKQKLAQALDDIAEILIRSLKKLHNLANDDLKEFKISQSTQVDYLVDHLKQIVTAYVQGETPEGKFKAIDAILAPKSDQLIAECDAQLAYTDNNYFPFLLKPYKKKRAILFDCLELLPLKSSTSDKGLESAIKFIQQNRHSRKQELALPQKGEDGYFLTKWIPKAWMKWIMLPPVNKQDKTIRVSKRYFEICVFSQLALELKSGDLFVQGSDQFADYRKQLISWAEYEDQIAEYASMMNLQVDPKEFTHNFCKRLQDKARQIDKKFPENSYVRLENDNLVIKKKTQPAISEDLKQLDKLLTERIPETNILDILVDTESWLNLSQDFGPVSGLSTRLENPQLRFIITLFCYGFNFGPIQTVRMLKGVSRRQIAWLNLRHVTEEKLDKAITKVINRYNNFMLPKQWGNGQHASADGTKWDVYEQNLLSEFHIRYGGYGGIGYYHVSDTYIALFSHFIPCGVYEALYILDGLLKNESEIQPTQLHGDTHAQSYTVFGLAHLLGIELMPRIRNIKELNFYKPHAEEVYQHIESLFDKPINWQLIEEYFPDMLRVALSIKAGKLTASAILRKLGTKSRKNKLYFAFRELGRAVRTEFLLRYIDDIELRNIIQAATCKSEEFNQFLKWSFFGSDGVISENDRYEQRKIIKYNHLVTNLIILHTMRSMTRALNQLSAEGYVIDPSLLKKLAPYRTQHINRFGSYTLNLNKTVEPLLEERDLNLQINLGKPTL